MKGVFSKTEVVNNNNIVKATITAFITHNGLNPDQPYKRHRNERGEGIICKKRQHLDIKKKN
jgi:hypothetical protein